MTAVPLELERPLAAPFDTPPSPDALRPSAATLGLVQSQVRALLDSTPSFHALPQAERQSVATNLVKIAGYAAECMREICWQSEQLGQIPVSRERNHVRAPMARAQEFQPAAASQVARITQETLRAIAFPTFVADLIKGTFRAITETNIHQMEAFGALVANVSGTVDQFMSANISDNQARDWLAQRYPEHIRVQNGQLGVRDGAEEREAPSFRTDLNLSSDVSLDESALEETLLPAARRRLAETRLQMLSTLVLMGMNRIVVTGGKIRATMGFHIDTTDRNREERASELDFRVQAAAQFGFAAWSASVSSSLTYVSSSRSTTDAEINTETDLTGEVELHFKSDYFPLQRFANAGQIGRISGNTAVPEANAPSAEAGGPFDAPPAAGGTVERFRSPRTRRTPAAPSTLRPIGTLPEVRRPDQPTAPDAVQRRPEQPSEPAAGGTTPTPETTTEPTPTPAPTGDSAPPANNESAGGTASSPNEPAPDAAATPDTAATPDATTHALAASRRTRG